MSRPRHAPPAPSKSTSYSSIDGAELAAPMVLTGVVKTTKGYAVAIAKFHADGRLDSLKLQLSQAFKEHVAREHKKVLVVEALRA